MMHDPQTIAWLDQEDAHLAQVIRAHRWSVKFVGAGDEPDEPPFGYTVGLFGLRPRRAGRGGARGRRRPRGSCSAWPVWLIDGRNLVAGELLGWPGTGPELRLVVEELPNPGEVWCSSPTASTSGPAEYSVPASQLAWAFPDH